ncbi:MAG: hypothetical protein ACE5F6_00055 [Anaerolineae bacterium]
MNNPNVSKPAPTPEDVMASMRIRILELSYNDSLIFDENDREYIMGLKMLMEMEEPLDISCAGRVNTIYQAVRQNAFTM